MMHANWVRQPEEEFVCLSRSVPWGGHMLVREQLMDRSRPIKSSLQVWIASVGLSYKVHAGLMEDA